MEATGMTWRKSSYSSNGGNCVETASDSGVVMVRDTKNPDGVALVIDAAAWSKFVIALR